MKNIKKIALVLLATLMLFTSTGVNVLAEDDGIKPDVPAEATYTATYEFVLESDEREDLPEEVLVLLPEKQSDLKPGDIAVAKPLDDVTVDDAVYKFKGWNLDEVTIEDSDVNFVGTWIKEKVDAQEDGTSSDTEGVDIKPFETDENVIIRYQFIVSPTFSSDGLPEKVMELLPEDGKVIELPSYSPVAGYKFNGWDTISYYLDSGEDITLNVGYWERIRFRAIDTPSHPGYPNSVPGYSNMAPVGVDGSAVPTLYVNGNHAYCVSPQYTGYPKASPTTSYWSQSLGYGNAGPMSERVANVIATCEERGVSTAITQAAVWDALGHPSSVGGVSIRWQDYYDDGKECWGEVYESYHPEGGQLQDLGYATGCRPKSAKVNVKKVSSKSNMTNGNALYSLAGAKYGVYSDAACTNLLATLTTDSNGNTGQWETKVAGTYYIKEISVSSEGFRLDPTIHSVSLSLGNNKTVTSTEEAMFDPSQIVLYKYNERNGRVYGYDQYLDEAQFTVKYYDTHSEDISGRSPKFTWVFKAEYQNVGGVQTAVVKFDTAHLVSATDRNTFTSDGLLMFPLGLVTIEETIAPTGFARDTGVYIGHIRMENGRPVMKLNASGTDILEIDNYDMTQREEMQTITINIQKKDKETGLAAPQGLEDLSGATFEIRYYDPITDQKYLVGTVVTDAEGKASLSKDINNAFDGQDLICGKYYITEITPPDGYQLTPGDPELTDAPDIYTVEPQEIEVDFSPQEINTAHFEYSYPHPNIYIRGGFTLTKHDSDFMENRPQGDATNLTTTYEVISLNEKDKLVDFNLDGREDKTSERFSNGQTCFRFTTDSQGNYTSKEHLLPKGKYRIVETIPPVGYLVEGHTISRDFEITKDGQMVDLNDEEWNELMTDDIIRGDVNIAKRDFESKQNSPLGGAQVDGAYVQIINRSANPITIYTNDGEMIEVPVGSVVPTMDGVKEVVVNKETGEKKEYTGITGVDSNGNHGRLVFHDQFLPYGTYDYVEIVPPTGYLKLNDPSKENLVGRFTIREDGVQVQKVALNEQALVNQVMRGDFEIRKIDSENQDLMAGIEFSIESVTTGEKHYFTTDENGYYSSANSWNKHSYDTNGGKADSGMWFGNYVKDGESEYAQSVPVIDEKGALPYDTYLITELRGPNNVGKKMFKGYVNIRRDNVVVPLNNVENVEIELKTTATSGVENSLMPKLVPAIKDTKIIDTVEYRNLRTSPATEYTLVTMLMDKATGMQVRDTDGNPVESEKTFTPTSANGTVKTEMIMNMENLVEGMDVVVFEFLYEDGELAAQHADLEDEGQTVTIPGLKTTATDNNTEAHVGQLGEITVTDVVKYTKLQVNRVYTITGTLMDKDTKEPVLDADGNKITDEVTFRARQSDGEVTLTFKFKVEEHGHSYVAFEELIYEEDTYAVHADINDEDQSIHYPDIRTSARNQGIQNLLAGEDATIIDTVSYTNLSPLHEYTVTGKLMDKDTNQPLLDAEGNEITGQTTFKPESNSGTVDVEFKLDASKLGGKRLVVFEKLFYGEFELVKHEDIEDSEQTIWVPEIATQAHDEEMDDEGNFYKNILLGKEAVLVDDVKYENLQPAHEYTATARLYDKTTGEILKDSEGNEITASTTFVAPQSSGVVQVKFVFDTTALDDHELVAFEKLFEAGVEIANHEDPEDPEQTVIVKGPEISTTATDEEGSKKAVKDHHVNIIDTVEYSGLQKGKEYKLEGRVYNKETGEFLKGEDGEVLVFTKVFTPAKRNGKVEMEIEIDGSKLDYENHLVVFEKLFIKGPEGEEGEEPVYEEVTNHEDPEDEEQTIEFYMPEIATTAMDDDERFVDRKDKAVAETKIEDKSKIVVFDSKIRIKDTVEYKYLDTEEEYLLKGILMNKKTGEPVKAGEATFESELEFKPETHSGTVDMIFEFDTANFELEDLDVVVFEELHHITAREEETIEIDPETGEEIVHGGSIEYEPLVDHKDINDISQWIHIWYEVPTMKTTATFSNGSKSRVPGGTVTIVDTIEYTGLDTAVEYTIKGVLVNKSDKSALSDVVEIKFTPETRDGKITMSFTVKTDNWGNRSTVVFEELYRSIDSKLIAEHKDINDKGQTVSFYVPVKPPVVIRRLYRFVKTGAGQAVILASTGIASAGIALLLINKKRKKEEEE